MNARDLNRKISVFSVSNDKDEQGFPTKTEALVLSCFAKAMTTRGYTLIKSGTDFEKAYTNFTIRYNNSVKRGMLIYYGEKRYRIDYCNNINEDEHWLELQAIEVEK